MRTKKYRALRTAYAKAKDAEKEDELKSIASEMNKLQEKYNVTWDFCRNAMIEINKTYKINSIFALSKAEDVWSAVEKCLYSDGKSMHFKKYGDYSEIRAKQSNRGIVISADGENLLFKLNGITFRPVITKSKHTMTRKGNPIAVPESHDIFAEAEVKAICRYLENPEVIDNQALSLYNRNGTVMDTCRPCFASIVCKRIRGKVRIDVHITIEGQAMTKYRKDGTKRHQTGKGVIGCDIGPQSIAYTSDKEVGLKNHFFIDEENAFINTEEFAASVRGSDNYFVLITRENLYNLPYSVEEIYGLYSSGKYQNTKKIYQQMYRIYLNVEKLPIKPEKIINEKISPHPACCPQNKLI